MGSSVRCLNCGADNPEGAAFCNECGSRLSVTGILCPACGTQNSGNAKFCMSCGVKLPGNDIQQSEGQDVSASDQILSETADQEQQDGSEMASIESDYGSDLEDVIENETSKSSVVDGTGAEGSFHKEAYQEKSDIKIPVQSHPHNKKKKKMILIGVAAVAVILILASLMGGPKIEYLRVSYVGNTEAGTVLDGKNEGIKVTGIDKDGEEHDLSDWTVEKPRTLEMDSSSTITIAYKDLSSNLTVACSTSELVDITASYSGDASEGIVLDSGNDGFTVTAHYKNGDEEVVSGWTIAKPQTLAADTTSNVLIRYEDKEVSLDVICTTVTIEKITAKYTGSTKAGVKVGEGSSDVTVTAVYKNGEKQKLTGWTVEKPVTLKEGETSKLKIHYGEYDCTLKIECTDLSKKQYKSKCKTYGYNEIARDPDDYEGKKAKFSGEVLQALESADNPQVDMRIAVDGDYDHVLYVVYIKPVGSSRILEGDNISVYGELGGVYTYTSTMNAQITIPIIYARYVE